MPIPKDETSTDVISTSTVTKAVTQSKEGQNGVPGFPDFPKFWCGEEGWVVWKRNKSKSKVNQKPKKVEIWKKQIRIRREAVNREGTAKIKVRKKSDDRKKRLQRLKHRRQMVSLRMSLESLSC
jgi:hypothetical protein